MQDISTASLAREFARKHSEGVVRSAIWTFRIVRAGATAIMIAAMWSNWDHVVSYLSQHTDSHTAKTFTVIYDVLAVSCARILALKVAHPDSKKAATRVLWIAVLASASVAAAAPGDLIAKAAYASIVVGIFLAEYVAGHLKVWFVALVEQETETAQAAVEAQPEKAGKKCVEGCKCGRHAPRKPRNRGRGSRVKSQARAEAHRTLEQELEEIQKTEANDV